MCGGNFNVKRYVLYHRSTVFKKKAYFSKESAQVSNREKGPKLNLLNSCFKKTLLNSCFNRTG